MSGAEDLVPTGEAREAGECRVRLYRPRVESGFARIEQWRNSVTGVIHWRTISADNTTRIYGEMAQARVSDPANDKHIFKWLLEFSHDGKGSAVSYRYKNEDDVGLDGIVYERRRLNGNVLCTNRYLKSVVYGNVTHFNGVDRHADYHFEVVFDYGEHNINNPHPDDDNDWPVRPDPFSDYRAGFEIRCRRRCERVLMFHRFDELGDAPCLARSVDFAYGGNDSDISLLTQAQQKGYIRTSANTYESKSLPAMTFAYQAHEWNGRVRELDTGSLSGLPAGLASEGGHFLDLYGEGLSGVLSEVGQGTSEAAGSARLPRYAAARPRAERRVFRNWRAIAKNI